MEEGTLVETGPDIIIAGDLHGSLHDARRVYHNFHVNLEGQKYVPAHVATSFCFLGNYVDRGDNSLEVLLLLFTMKLSASCYNQRVIMLRGNHETREMNYAKGFRAELHAKFEKEQADDLFEKFNDVFDHMPLACVIANRHLCVHGGISPKLASLDSIRNIPKPLKRVDKNKLACDLLWADFKEGINGFEPNTERDISVRFGEDVLEEMLDKLRLEFLIRSHQKVKDGAECNGLMITISSFSGKNCKDTIGTVRIHPTGDAEMGVCAPFAGHFPFTYIKEDDDEAENPTENPSEKGDFVIEMGDN